MLRIARIRAVRREHRRYWVALTLSDCCSFGWIEPAPDSPRFSVHQSVRPADRDDRATDAHRAAPRLLTRRGIDPVQVRPTAAGRVTLPTVQTPTSQLGLRSLGRLVNGRGVRVECIRRRDSAFPGRWPGGPTFAGALGYGRLDSSWMSARLVIIKPLRLSQLHSACQGGCRSRHGWPTDCDGALVGSVLVVLRTVFPCGHCRPPCPPRSCLLDSARRAGPRTNFPSGCANTTGQRCCCGMRWHRSHRERSATHTVGRMR